MIFTRKDFLSTVKSSYLNHRLHDYEIDMSGPVFPMPGYITASEEACFSRARLVEMTAPGGKRHNVVICYSPITDEVVVHCGSGFLENEDYSTRLIEEAANCAVRVKEVSKENVERVVGDMKDRVGSLPKSSGCNFWRNDHSCKHTEGLLNLLHTSGELPEILASIVEPLYEVEDDEAAAAVEEVDPLISKLTRYAFRKHVMLEGDKGSGKTYGIQSFLRAEGVHQVQLNGHEGIEAIDMLGYDVRKGNDTIWKDGKVAEAFRLAAKGKRVALFIDEIARIPRRQLNMLVAALSPNDNDEYVLPTGRMVGVVDGIGQEETLVVHKSKLWAVGTMNVGADYDVDELDEALTDRFRPFRKDSDAETIRMVLRKICKTRKLKLGLANKLVTFWNKAERLRNQGELSRPITMRHLAESVELADSEEDVLTNLEDCILLWVDRDPDGKPIQGQIDLIHKIMPKP